MMLTGLQALGQATTSTDPGIVAGLTAWTSPSTAWTSLTTALSSPSDAFATMPMFNVGLILAPVAVLGIAMSFLGGGRRR